jgi:hypothetical protein
MLWNLSTRTSSKVQVIRVFVPKLPPTNFEEFFNHSNTRLAATFLACLRRVPKSSATDLRYSQKEKLHNFPCNIYALPSELREVVTEGLRLGLRKWR